MELPQGWSVRRIPCFAGRNRPIYVPPQVRLLADMRSEVSPCPCVRCAICERSSGMLALHRPSAKLMCACLHVHQRR